MGPRPVLLFDLDDTLISEEKLIANTFLATCELARQRHGIDPDILYRAVRRRARELWRKSPMIEACQGLGISSWEGLWSAFPGDLAPMPGLRAWTPTYRAIAWERAFDDCGVRDAPLAEELARHLPGHLRVRDAIFSDSAVLRDLRPDYQLGLITNGPSDLQRAKLRLSELERYFDAIVISAEVGAGKPAPHVFAHTLAALDVPPDAAVMIGDNLDRDVAGARNAGIRPIWLNRTSQHQPPGRAPFAEITTLAALPAVLGQDIPVPRTTGESDPT